jgi:uncharacterized membrane protein
MPAPVVEADAYERTLSLFAYVWVALSVAFSSATVLYFSPTINDIMARGINAGGGLPFGVDIGALVVLVLPLALMSALKSSQLVRFHAKQAMFIGVFFLVAMIVIGLLDLIPEPTVRGVVVHGILVGGLKILFAWLALTAGVRAFFYRELYRAPMVGGMVK